jgi:hypothetical protein
LNIGLIFFVLPSQSDLKDFYRLHHHPYAILFYLLPAPYYIWNGTSIIDPYILTGAAVCMKYELIFFLAQFGVVAQLSCTTGDQQYIELLHRR